MNNLKFLSLALILLLTLTPGGAYADGAGELSQLQSKVRTKLSRLEQLIDQAESKGLATEYAKVSATVIRYYQRAAQHDFDNIEEIRELYNRFPWSNKLDPKAPDELPFEQLRDCIDEADHAIQELERQLAGEILLVSPPDFLDGKLTLATGNFHLDGRVAFPYSVVWLPGGDTDLLRALGTKGSGFYQLTYLEEDGSVNPGLLASNLKGVQDKIAQNMSPHIYLTGHAAAQWMKETHPETIEGARYFTRYDIDNPLIRQWIKDLYSQLIPPISEALGDFPMIHLVSNEPHFSIRQGGWKSQNSLSELTLDKYRGWIKDKYQTIEKLNAVYGTDYRSFEELDTTNPISIDLRGGPIWYDWCRFNMDRVNEWFTFLANESRRHDVKGNLVSIKMLGHHLVDPMYDHGMDIEYLTKLQDVQGADLRAAPTTANFYTRHEQGLDPETNWTARYNYDWLSQAIFLDFTRSLRPDSPFYDSEWHGFSTVSWRDFNLDRDYARAAIWHAFTHGMSGISPWVWGRRLDGSIRPGFSFVGELSSQPIAVSAFGRTMKELNAHAPVIAAMVPRQRNFVVFYCQEAAIQSEAYTHRLCDVYEALKIQNYAVGFTTPSEIKNLDPAEQIVFVSPTEFIADDSLAALSRFTEAGGRLVVVEGGRDFTRNELGQPRAELPELEVFKKLPVADVETMAESFGTLFDPFKVARAVEVEAISQDGKAWGLLAQEARMPDTGDVFVALNNGHKHPAEVVLTPTDGGPASFVNVLTGKPFESPVMLDPSQVMLLKLVR